MCAVAGVLVVAHEKGEVRVYQHSAAPREVTCCHLGPAPGCGPVPDCHIQSGRTVVSLAMPSEQINQHQT